MDRFGLSAQFDFNSGNSANQISGISSSIAGLIDTIQDLEKAVGSSDNFGKKIAKQLDFAPKKTQMRGVARDVQAIGDAATVTKKNLSPLKDEFRAIRAESRNIDLGDLGDDKQYKKGRAELIAYTKSLKSLQGQVKGNSTAEREFNASLIAGQKAAKGKLEIMESQRKALAASEKVGISNAAVVVGRAAIDPVKQFATDSMKILAEFDDKMAAVAAVVQPTTEQLKGLRKQAAALGASTRYDAAQAAEAMGELGSAGFTTQQIMIGISDTLSLASAGALGLAEAAEISASSLNGFGMEVNQLGHVVDVFAIAAAKTNAGIQDIGETMKYAAPSAAMFGATIEETTALIGTMANAGIKGSSSGTALRSMFTRLASPTGPAQAALDSMGVNIKDAKGKLRNVMEIMDDLQLKMGLNAEDLSKQKAFFNRIAASGENVDEAIAKLKKSGDKQAANIETIKTLVGAEAMGGFSTALQNSAKTKQAVYAEMAGSFDQSAFNKVLLETTAENKNFDELRAAFADKSAAGQEKFKKIDIFKYISEATGSYTEATGLINKATDGLAIQGASSVVGDNLKLVQKTLEGFKDTDEQFAGQFKDIDFSQFGNGVDLLGALVKGTGDTKKGMYQFQSALKATGISIAAFTGAGKNMADVMENSLPGDIRNMESALDSVRLNSIEPFEPLIRGIINAISGFANTLANLPKPVLMVIGAIQMLVFALGGLLFVGGSIGIILFGFEQAAATAAIATTVLEGSTIALTGFFGTSLAAAAATNPLNTQLNILRGTAGKLVAPLGALKTLVMELGRAMLAQMVSPLGLTLIGLTALYFIFEALTPQFDVLGRLLGGMVAPFGFIYGFVKGIAKALMTLIAPIVKISTTAAGFPFISVAKSLAMAVDYFTQFASKGEAAGVAFVDYFAAPIVMAATLIANAWNGAIGNIQGYMDGLVQYALNIAQMLINALNHNPTEKIPNSWDGAVERITAGLQSLVGVAKMVAAAMVAAFNWVVELVQNIPMVGDKIAGFLTNTASQLHGYLDTQFDFDVAGMLISQLEAGEASLSSYFEYFGKTFLPGLFATWMAGPMSQYFNKFTGLAGTFTGLKFEDIISIEEFDIGATLAIFDRLNANATELFSTFRSGADLVGAAFTTFSDPDNTANFLSKSLDLIANGFAGVSIQAQAAWKMLGLFLGGGLISVLPTIGLGIKLVTMAVQFVFKTVGGAIVGFVNLFGIIGSSISSASQGFADFKADFDLQTFFSDAVGAIDRVTTALGDNLNVLSLMALVGSTLPLGFIFSKGAITKELFKEIPAFYKAISLLLPAGMGTIIANGLTDEMIFGLGDALKSLGAGLINTLGIALDWYGLMKRDDFDAAISGMGQKFEEAKTSALNFVMGIYNLSSVKPVVDGLASGLIYTFNEVSIQMEYLNMAIRYVFDLLKTGVKIGDFNISIVDLLGLDIAIKALQGFVRILSLESFSDMLKSLFTSFKGLGGIFFALGDAAKIANQIFEGFYQSSLPPLLQLFNAVKTFATESYKLISTAIVDTTRATLSALRAINPEFYDILAGNAQRAAKVVGDVAKAGQAQAVAAAVEAQAVGEAVVEAVAAAEAVQKLTRFGRFLSFLATTPLKPLVPIIAYLGQQLILIVKTLYAFPAANFFSAIGFLKSLPYAEIIAFVKAIGLALYDTFAIVRFGIDGFGRLIKDGGKVASFLANFGDIYKKSQGLSAFGIKAITPIDMLLAGVRGFNSELSKVSLKKFYQIGGSLEFSAGQALELGNILKNFGLLQRAALLPGVISYLAAWGGAGLVIFPILKGLAKVFLMSLGRAAEQGFDALTHLDYGAIGMAAGKAFLFLFLRGLVGIGSLIGTAFGAIFPQVAAFFQSLQEQWSSLNTYQKIGVGIGAVLVAGIIGAIATGMTTAGGIISATVAIATSQGGQVALAAIAAGLIGLVVWNRDAIWDGVTGVLLKIPGLIAAAFEVIKKGFVEAASTILAIAMTIGFLSVFMGKQIQMIIGTAFGSIIDGAKALKPKRNKFSDGVVNFGRSRSDLKVDKDSTAINKEVSALSRSNTALGRTLTIIANKTLGKKMEIVPEYERAGRAAKIPRREELNLLDRQVQSLAEQNLRDRKVKGDGNGKSGMFAKFSASQLEAESAAVYRNTDSIRKAAFNVKDSADALYQTDKNVQAEAAKQLASNPAIRAEGKKGNYSAAQIQAQSMKIRADKDLMAKLTIGQSFSNLASDLSLASTEALKGLGQDKERQKFIDGKELIDEDLTIKAAKVELYVDRLDLGDDKFKRSQMTDAAMAVANNKIAYGIKAADVKIDDSSVNAIYKSFSQLKMRPKRDNPANGPLRYGQGNNVSRDVIDDFLPQMTEAERNLKISAADRLSIRDRSVDSRNNTLSAVASNMAASLTSGDYSREDTDKYEAQLIFRLAELAQVVGELTNAYDTNNSPLPKEKIKFYRESAAAISTGDKTLDRDRVADYLSNPKNADTSDLPIFDSAALRAKLPEILKTFYGEDTTGARDRARTTGSYLATADQSKDKYQNIADLELLQQLMVDLIGKVQADLGVTQKIGGEQMALVAKLFVGNKEDSQKQFANLNPDGFLMNNWYDSTSPDKAFQLYGTHAEATSGTKPGDINYDAINATYQSERERVLQAMEKDFAFFKSATDKFTATVMEVGKQTQNNPIQILDLLTSPDIVNDLDFGKLIAGMETGLNTVTNDLLMNAVDKMAQLPDNITPSMKKNAGVWGDEPARRTAAMARMVGLDVEKEVSSGLKPAELATKAASVRSELGLALQSFMTLAIPDNAEIKAAMARTYQQMGVGNTIDWDEVLPLPKGAKPTDPADRYKAIAAQFNRTPQELAAKKTEVAFMQALNGHVQQKKKEPNTKLKAESVIKGVVASSLLDGMYTADGFDKVVKGLGLTKQLENSPTLKVGMEQAGKISVVADRQKAEQDARMYALGELYIKQSLGAGNAKHLGNLLGGNDAQSQDAGFENFMMAIAGQSKKAGLEDGGKDFNSYLSRTQGATSRNSIEAVLSNMVEANGNPKQHAEKIRAAAILIANGQLDLLSPELLLAVAKHTKNSVATLIRPEFANNDSGKNFDKVQVNILRRLEIQRRLKAKGLNSDALDEAIGASSDKKDKLDDHLYKGRFGALSKDGGMESSLRVAALLNTNGKTGQEALVELTASLSNQTLLNKHQAELDKHKIQFFKDSKRADTLKALAAEAMAQRQRDEIAAAEKAKAGQQRYDKLMLLAIAQNPEAYDEMSAYGLPRDKNHLQPGSYSDDPEVDKLVGGYNLVDILGKQTDEKFDIKSPFAKSMEEFVKRLSRGRDSKSTVGAIDQQLVSRLGNLAQNLGIDNEGLANLENVDLTQIFSPADIGRAEEILAQMNKYDGRKRSADLDAQMGMGNKSRRSARRMESLLMQIAPQSDVKIVDTDPKQYRRSQIDRTLTAAGVKIGDEEGKPKMADNFYQRAISGAKMPMDGVLEEVRTARSSLEAKLGRENLLEPEIAKFMSELAAVEAELVEVVANNSSPVKAISKLLRLENKALFAKPDTPLAKINDGAPIPALATRKIFGEKSLPADLLPEVFGSVQSGTGASARMMNGIDPQGMSLDKSTEFQLAQLAADLQNLTGGYQVHNKKLLELRAKFVAGSDDFFGQITSDANADLLRAADDGQLLEALLKMYRHAATANIDLTGAGLSGQLAKNQADPGALGLDAKQMQLVREFADGTQSSDLTLDPTIRNVASQLETGSLPSRKELSDLQKTMIDAKNLEFFVNPPMASGDAIDNPALPGQAARPMAADSAQKTKAEALITTVKSTLADDDFNFDAKADRELVDVLYANGKANAAIVGEAIAAQYSVLYAYANSSTNKIDASDLMAVVKKVAGPDDNAAVLGMKALQDLIEGRRKTIDKFNEAERGFLEEFRIEIGLSEKQLFDLENAIPKTMKQKILASGPQAWAFVLKQYQAIAKQKDHSLDKFLTRSGLDYEQVAQILKQEGFNALQVQQIFTGHDKDRRTAKGASKTARTDLIKQLVKYGGMNQSEAKKTILDRIKAFTTEDAEQRGLLLQETVEKQIKDQKYSKKVEDKILANIQTSRDARSTTNDRYADAADPGLLLSSRLGATTEQIKKLASLMGVNHAELDRLFTDKGGVMGELAYAGDYFKIAQTAFDPVNLNRQMARIFSGTKMGNHFATQAAKIVKEREQKMYKADESLKASMILDPIVGSLLRKFKTPAEAALDWVIGYAADRSDWINKTLSGRMLGAKGASNLFKGVENRFRDLKFKAKDIDNMPGIRKNVGAFFGKKPAPVPDPTVATGEFVDDSMPVEEQYLLPGGAPQPDPRRSIGDGLRQAFTVDGAKANLQGLAKFSIDNPLNQAIKRTIEEIGHTMQSAAQEAIEATGGTQIVTARDEAGVRTYINEQRNPLRTLQKKAGQMLVKYADPMGNIYRSIGEDLIQFGEVGVNAIELLEKGIAKSNSSGFTAKLQSMGGKARNYLSAGILSLGETIDVAFLGGEFGSNTIAPMIDALKQKIGSTVGTIFESIGNAFGQLTGTTGSALRDALSSVFGTIKGLFRRFQSIGRGVKAAAPVVEPVVASVNPTPSTADSTTAIATTSNLSDEPSFISKARPGRRKNQRLAAVDPNATADLNATTDRLLAQNGIDPRTGLPFSPDTVDFVPNIDPDDINRGNARGASGIIRDANPVPQNPAAPGEILGRTSSQPIRPNRGTRSYNPVSRQNPVSSGEMVVYQPPANPVPDPDIIDADVVSPQVPQIPKVDYGILDEGINQKIEENWDGTSDKIIKNIKHLALVSKKLGYWIMRNLSEGSPGPTYYMRQHYADTTDFIEADLRRLVTVSQRSGAAIQAGLMGNHIDLNLSDLPKANNMAISSTPVVDDDFNGALTQAEQFESANVAAANLAANAALVENHTTDTATAMMDVAKGEVKVDQKGKKLFKFFNVMWRAMKIVPKGFVKMGQVFKKIGKPVMMMGAGFSAAGFAIQNINSNLATLGLVNEQQSEMIQKGSAVMEIFGGIGAIGGAAMQVLSGGLAFVLEAGVTLLAVALNPITYAVLGIGAAVIAGIFALNWLSKTFLGFDFIAPVFGGIEDSMSSLSTFITSKVTPIVSYLRFQFAQTFGYGALAKLDGAISWLSKAWNIGFKAIAAGLSWLGGVMSQASEHTSGIVGVLAIAFAPLIAIGFLTFKLFEALFNAIAPGLAGLMPVLDELAVKFQAAFGPTIDWIVGAWTGGLDKIGGMLVGLWHKAEDIGNWLIGALNCNPTVAIPLAWQGATDNIMGMMNYLPDHAKATADKMVGFFGKAFDWLGGKKPEDIESKVGLTKTTTESTIVDPISGSTIPAVAPAVTPPVEPIVTPSLPIVPASSMPALPDWMGGIGSLVAQTMSAFDANKPVIPLPVDPTGSLDAAKGVQSAMTDRSTDIKSRSGLMLHAGAEHKAERLDAAASGISDLVSQSESLKSEYEELANPTGWKKQIAFIGRITGSTQQRTKEIIKQRGEIEKTIETVVDGAKSDLAKPIGGDLLVRLGIDPDALDTAGTEIQAGVTTLGQQLVTGIQDAVAPVATYWDDAMTSVAEIGVGGTAKTIFGHALWNITEGVGTCGMAFKDLGGEVFESLKTMDFKRMANAGKMFTSAMGEGLGQIVRGFQDAANGAAFFAAFSVTSGFLPALIFGGLALLLIYLTLKFGNLREIAVGAFQVMSGAAKVFLVALQSIKPIALRLGDAFKGVFAAIKGDFDPLKLAVANLKLEFEVMFARMAPGFAQIKDGLKLIAKGFQPVIDEGIIPMVEGVEAAFGRVVDFILDPFRKAIAGIKQFGVDLVGMAASIVADVQAEFAEVFSTIGGAAKFAFESVQGFFDDFGRGIRNIVDIVATTISDIGSIFTTGIADISGAFKAAWEGIGIGSTGIEGIGRGIKLVAGEVASLGGNILSSLGGATEGIRGEIGKVGAAFIETNKDLFASFQKGFDRIGQLFPNLFKIFSDGVNDFTAYFTVKFQGIIDFVTGIFEAIGKVAGKAWELAGLAFGKFDELLTAGITSIQSFAAAQFAKIGDVFGSIGDRGKAAFDNVLSAAQPIADGIVAIFTGTVRDLDNLVQSGLDGFNGMVEGVATGFTTAFTNIATAGTNLGENLAAIPASIGMAFNNLTGSIGNALTAEFTSIKTSGSELLTALTDSFQAGTEQIGLLISGITGSFTAVSDSIASTIENLKATFSGLGETIDGAMGKAFGGVKDKWQKTTGFMGKMMGKVAGDSEETGQLILHNMAENSPGPTEKIRERYAYTAKSVSASLASIADAAEANGGIISESMASEMDALFAQARREAVAAKPDKKAALGRLGGNTAQSSNAIGNLLSFAGQDTAAGGFRAVAAGIDTVTTALDATKIAKEIGEDFKVLQGVMKGFSAVDAASKVGDMATGLMEAGKAAWGAITGFGQWIAAKLFQTSVGVTAEATLATASVVGGTATTAANGAVATSNAVVAQTFVAAGTAGGTAWSLILAPILPIIAAIAALIAIVMLVKTAFDNNFLGFGDLMYGIGDAIGYVWNIFTGFLGALWNGFAAIVGGVFGSLMTTIGEIGTMFSDLGKELSAPFVALFEAVGGLFAPIVAMFPQVNNGLSGTSMMVKVLLFPFEVLGKSLQTTIWLFGLIIKAIVFVAGLVIKILVAPFMTIIKAVTAIFRIFAMLRNAVVAIGSAVWSAIVSPFEFVTNLVKGLTDALGQLFSGPLGFLGGVFGFNPKPTVGADVQQFSTGGFVSGAGGPTDDKIPAMLSNGEFVIGAAATARNRSFLEAINSGMAAEDALQLIDIPHPVGELPDRTSAASAPATTSTVTVANNYNITISFGDIIVQGATGTEAAEDLSRFLQSTEFQLAVQSAMANQVESMR